MKIGFGMAMTAILAVIGIVILLNVLNGVLPTGFTAVHNLSDTMQGQGAVIGTGPAELAGNIDEWSGWLWVAVILGGIFTLVGGVLVFKRSRRYGRR